MSGDRYKRRLLDPSNPDIYQCGCRWTKEPGWGDVLALCPFHAEINSIELEQYERKQAGRS